MSEHHDEHPLEYPPAIEGVPYTRAWKDGRRIYVASAYKSKLSDALWNAGFTWDRDLKAHYVGAGKAGLAKLEQVTPAVREAEEYARRSAELKAAGHWVEIPLGKGMAEIREAAKKLGARFDGARKEWALPTAEAAAQVTALVEAARPARARKAPAAPVPAQDGEPGSLAGWFAAQPGAVTVAPAPARRPARKCDNCGKGRQKHERFDSSGIPGMVCDTCDREPDYALSFA